MLKRTFYKHFMATLALLLLVVPELSPVLAQQGKELEQEIQAYKPLIQRARENGTAREMTLEQCIELALKNNLNIELNRYQPLINKQQLEASLGVYDFQLEGTVGYRKNESPITDAVTRSFLGLDASKRTNYQADFTLSRYLSTGANVQVSGTNSRSVNNTNQFNPTFSGTLSASVTQPLWRDFRIDQNRRSILIAKKNVNISEIQFEDQMSAIVQNVETTYWNLVNAIEQQKISIQSRELAQIQLNDNEKRVEIGTLAPITITQTRSEVAQAEQGVISAEATIIQYQNALKNLIYKDTKNVVWQQVIIPTDQPVITEQVFSQEEALKLAMEKRPEIRTLKLNLDIDDINIHFSENQTKPRLDFTASYTSYGTAGPTYKDALVDQNGVPILDPNGDRQYIVDGPFTGKLGTAYKQIFKQDYPNYNLSLTFVYTFGNRTAKANLASARINKDQDQTQMKQQVQNIEVEVLNAIWTIQTNRKNLESAILTRQLREEQLDGETKRFQAGLSTNFEVLQAQRDLATAKGAELRARIELKKAVVDLQRYTFTNLDNYNIEAN